MNYIIFKPKIVNKHLEPFITIFSEDTLHSEFAAAIEKEFPLYAPASAGKLHFPIEAIDNIFVHGTAPTLNMKPTQMDDDLIKKDLKRAIIH